MGTWAKRTVKERLNLEAKKAPKKARVKAKELREKCKDVALRIGTVGGVKEKKNLVTQNVAAFTWKDRCKRQKTWRAPYNKSSEEQSKRLQAHEGG